MVNQDLGHFNVPMMKYFEREEILTLQTSTFVMSDPRNFNFIGSIRLDMLERVPLDNAIVREHRKLPSSCVHPMSADLRKLIDESNKLKHGGKRKAKAPYSESVRVPKNTRSQQRNQDLHLRYFKKNQNQELLRKFKRTIQSDMRKRKRILHQLLNQPL